MICPGMQYPLNDVCTPCINNCDQCVDNLSCDICEFPYVKRLNECILDCPD